MIDFSDNKFDKLELFLIIFLAVSLFAFIIYIVVSNNKNKKILINKSQSLRKIKETLRINFDKEMVYIYDNNRRICVAKYTFQEFKSLVDYKNLDTFNDWLEKIKEKNLTTKLSVGLYFINVKNSIKNYVKFTLLNYNRKTKEAFASIEEINRNFQFSEKLLDNLEFFESVNKVLGVNKNSISGTIIILKITNMEFLRKRYGNENANILLGEMFHRISTLNQEEDIFATYMQNNIFCLFKVGINDKKQAKSYITQVIDELISEPVNILDKQVEPAVNVSYSIYGEKTYDLKLAVSFTIKQLERNTFKFVKNRYIFNDNIYESETSTQNKELEIIRDIIAKNNFKNLYEPIVCTEQLSVLGFMVHSKFNINTDEDNFLTAYNTCEKYGLRTEFLYMYYRHLFNTLLESNPKHYRIIVKVELAHLDIIKNVWLENVNYSKIHLVLAINYEEIIHPKKQINFNQIFNEFYEIKIKFALIADENMLTIVSNVIYRVDLIIFDEYMVSNIETSDMKQITIDNIINNTQNNKFKYIAYGINKYEQAEILNKLDVDNLAGNYISLPLEDIHNQEFLKNRSVRALMNDPSM